MLSNVWKFDNINVVSAGPSFPSLPVLQYLPTVQLETITLAHLHLHLQLIQLSQSSSL